MEGPVSSRGGWLPTPPVFGFTQQEGGTSVGKQLKKGVALIICLFGENFA